MTEGLQQKILTTWLRAIRQLLSDNSVTIIFAEQPGPRPEKPYISLKLLAGPSPLGSFDDFRRDETTQNRFVISGMRQYTLNIQVFGPDSLAIVDQVQTLMDSPNIFPLLRNDDVDLAVVERGGVDDISELLDTGYEARVSMDVVFNAAVNVVVDPGTIESVEWSGEIENGDTIEVSGTVPEA